MRILLQIIIVLAPTFASKEHVPLRNLPDNEKDILFQLVKRLGKDNDYEYSLGWSGDAQSQSSSQCIVSTNTSSIIKRIDSENNGAKFLTLHDEVATNEACSDLCCKNKTCDLAVYENKGEHHCYLFQCEGKCLFGHHSSYISNSMRYPAPSPQGQQTPPAAATDGSELDLMNLNQDLGPDVDSASSTKDLQQPGSFSPPATTHSPAAAITQAPTAAPYIRAHSVGLEGALCLQNLHCEDPNAVCNYHKCRCREGYYQKGHICRKNCAPSQFGCLELGTLGRGPECVAKSQVCDSVMQCADGSDEFNCPDAGGSYKNEGSLDKDHKPILQGGSTGKLTGGSVDKSDTAATGDSLVPGVEGDVSSDSGNNNENQPSSAHQQPSSSSSSSESDNNNSDNKQSAPGGDSDNNNNNQPAPLNSNPVNKAGDNSKDRDSLSEPMPTEDDKLHSLSKEEGISDLAKDSESSLQDKDNSFDNGNPNDLVHSQNAFISRTKLVLPAAETANMQGPIIALSLGLAFTLILLVFVACRLRNVRRRLRKGRPLHSNEADYLINGMYL